MEIEAFQKFLIYSKNFRYSVFSEGTCNIQNKELTADCLIGKCYYDSQLKICPGGTISNCQKIGETFEVCPSVKFLLYKIINTKL